MEAETLAPSLDLWWNIHRPSVAALVESLGISCRAEDAWKVADVLMGTHPGGLVALDAMIGNAVDVSPQLRQNQVRWSSAEPRHGAVTRHKAGVCDDWLDDVPTTMPVTTFGFCSSTETGTYHRAQAIQLPTLDRAQV